MKKAISLVELVIAISLMGVVVLGATVFDISSHKFMRSAELKTAVTNELHLVLDYMQRDVANSTTSFSSISVGSGSGLRMFYDVGTPSSPGTNNVTYVFGNFSTTSVERCNTAGTCTVLSQRFILGVPPFTILNNYSATVTTPTVRYNPSIAMDNSNNPQVSVPTITIYASETSRS